MNIDVEMFESIISIGMTEENKIAIMDALHSCSVETKDLGMELSKLKLEPNDILIAKVPHEKYSDEAEATMTQLSNLICSEPHDDMNIQIIVIPQGYELTKFGKEA